MVAHVVGTIVVTPTDGELAGEFGEEVEGDVDGRVETDVDGETEGKLANAVCNELTVVVTDPKLLTSSRISTLIASVAIANAIVISATVAIMMSVPFSPGIKSC